MNMKRNEILHYVMNFIFPKHCVICDEILPFGKGLSNDFLCENCKNKLDFIEEPSCKKCGAKIYEKDEGYCDNCKHKLENNNSYYEYGFGLFRYNNYVKESLHKIKYNSKKEYIEFYAKLMAKAFGERIKNIYPDCFVPVPIYKDREIERGYNQSKVIADYLSFYLSKNGIKISVNNELVKRIKKTSALNKLSNEERKKELKDAFLVNNSNNINTVIIIDDIYTTGTTIEAIAKCLKEVGVKNVYFVTVAVVDNL